MASNARQSVFGGRLGLSLYFVVLPLFMAPPLQGTMMHGTSPTKRRPAGRPCKQCNIRRLLRRDAHLGCGGAHVGIDVLLILDEVLLEHAHELARGVVEGGFVLP